jgi:hypothetical protein
MARLTPKLSRASAPDNGPSELLGKINDISDALYDSIRFADGIRLALTGLSGISGGGRGAEAIAELASHHLNALECIKDMVDAASEIARGGK